MMLLRVPGLLLWLTSVAQAVVLQGRPSRLNSQEINGFNWSQITPSSELRWTPCYGSYSCARLQVPLDWNNSSNPSTVAIALSKVPATVPHHDPAFAGSVLINPGGPGGSGVDEVMWAGYGMRNNIIDSEYKHYEIIGFDPRGVHHTTPGVSCFGSDWNREVWQYRNWAVGQLDASTNAFDVQWASYESLSGLCSQANIGKFEDGSNMRQFVTTALTARDMIAIIDALQHERTSKAVQELSASNQQPLHGEVEPALLNYWGFSYGTYLGNTFASMFPDRVGRMVLDGNVDPIDYTNTSWQSNLFDHDKNLHWFYYACYHAKEKCALFDSNTKSLFDLEKKVIGLLHRLQMNPLAVFHDGAADLVTSSDFSSLIHGAAYAPLYFWQDVAQVAHDLLNNNGTTIIKYLKNLQIPANPELPEGDGAQLLKNDTLPYPPDFSGGLEGAISILCGDGEPLSSMTKHDWQLRLAHLKNQSIIAGPIWAAIPFACQHWPAALRPSENNRFTGPFASSLANYDKRGSPILFIGNTADPVTPLRNAVENSKHHEGSVVLTQDSPGHCAGPVNPSRCTFEVLRNFFAKGTLPKPGKICMGDRSAWESV